MDFERRSSRMYVLYAVEIFDVQQEAPLQEMWEGYLFQLFSEKDVGKNLFFFLSYTFFGDLEKILE